MAEVAGRPPTRRLSVFVCPRAALGNPCCRRAGTRLSATVEAAGSIRSLADNLAAAEAEARSAQGAGRTLRTAAFPAERRQARLRRERRQSSSTTRPAGRRTPFPCGCSSDTFLPEHSGSRCTGSVVLSLVSGTHSLQGKSARVCDRALSHLSLATVLASDRGSLPRCRLGDRYNGRRRVAIGRR